MTHSNKALTFVFAVAFTTALTGLVHGQVPGATRPAEVPGNAALAADDNQQSQQQLIAHALGMAINASELQFAAQAARRDGRGQGQEQGRNRDANDQNDDDANNDNQKRNNDPQRNADRNQGDRNQGDRTANFQAHQQAVQQLEREAWKQFTDGNQLLRTAHQEVTARDNAPAGRGDERAAWSRRLYNAANEYSTTLRHLSGIGSRQPAESGSVGGQGQGQQDQDRNTGRLNRTDAARVSLINHAVRESLAAFELNQDQAGRANRAVAMNASAQQLQEHTRQMATESRQILQRIVATLNQQDDQGRQNNPNRQENQGQQRNQDNRRDPANPRDQGGNDPNNPQGQYTVQLLAQQAQQVIDTLQRISPIPGAPTR